MILIHCLVQDPVRIEFCYPGREKPYLASTSGGEGPRFKISQSHHLASFAFAYDREVGVDLEYIDPIQNIELIATRNFSADERVEFQKLQDKQKVKAVCACWTRKEAYLKAVGNGLTHAPEKMRFHPRQMNQLSCRRLLLT
jgi:4'-phosphopantetheinyl transferase